MHEKELEEEKQAAGDEVAPPEDLVGVKTSECLIELEVLAQPLAQTCLPRPLVARNKWRAGSVAIGGCCKSGADGGAGITKSGLHNAVLAGR